MIEQYHHLLTDKGTKTKQRTMGKDEGRKEEKEGEREGRK